MPAAVSHNLDHLSVRRVAHPRALLKALAVSLQSRSACHSAVRCSPAAMSGEEPSSAVKSLAAAMAVARNCSLMRSVASFTCRHQLLQVLGLHAGCLSPDLAVARAGQQLRTHAQGGLLYLRTGKLGFWGSMPKRLQRSRDPSPDRPRMDTLHMQGSGFKAQGVKLL